MFSKIQNKYGCSRLLKQCRIWIVISVTSSLRATASIIIQSVSFVQKLFYYCLGQLAGSREHGDGPQRSYCTSLPSCVVH